MSDVIEITSKENLDNGVDLVAELNKVLQSNDKVVVDFAAPAWCGPCIRFAPHFKAAAERSDAAFVHVDIDHAPDLVNEYNIQSVPTVLGFVNDKLTATIESRTAIPLLREIEAL